MDKQSAIADNATTTATIANATPTIGAFNINNSDASISFSEATNGLATTTVTVTDGNSCQDIASVIEHFYRTDKTNSCATNGYDCYATSSCTIVETGNTCDNAADTSADYTCSVAVNYYSNATDENAAASSTTWTMLVTASDSTTSGTNSDTIEIASLSAIDVTTPIAYGSLALSADSADQEQTITNTGNLRLDIQASGSDMTCTPGTIAVAQQKYSTSTITDWTAGTYTLSGSPAEKDYDLVASTGSTSTQAIHWMLRVPADGADGSCSGSNTFTPVNDDQAQD